MKEINVEDLNVLEVSGEDMTPTPEDIARENERIINEVLEEGKKIKDVDDKVLIVEGHEDYFNRQNAALDILEKEKALQVEREKEWLKEKKKKRRVRRLKAGVLIAIAGFIALAWLSGFRIEIPQEVINTFDGMWQSVRDFVINFFSHNG